VNEKDPLRQALSDLFNENASSRNIEITLDPYSEKEERFSKVRQGSMTNSLTKINLTKDNASLNPITDVATLSEDKLSISLMDFSSISVGLKTTTHKLLDAMTSVFTENGAVSPTVHLPLDVYMSMCGLRDKKEARRQVKADLNTLLHLSLSFSSSYDWDSDFMNVMLCSAAGIVKGVIVMEFSRPIYETLKRYGFMPYPRQLWALNPQYNPNSYYFLRKISEHKHMNLGKSNEDIISVRTLLAASPLLPKYGEISKTGQVDQRIIQPFQRDMTALSNTLEWSYYTDDGEPFNQSDDSPLTYAVFAELMLHIDWLNYPALDPEFTDFQD